MFIWLINTLQYLKGLITNNGGYRGECVCVCVCARARAHKCINIWELNRGPRKE